MAHVDDAAFPCRLSLQFPFPSHRLAQSALRALSVDQELSPLVRRSFSLTDNISPEATSEEGTTVLHVIYSATTNRMLRVAVNGFFESLGVVLGVMEELDVDSLCLPGKEDLKGVQGLVEIPVDGLKAEG